MKSELGDLIRRARKAKGLTQTELAELADLAVASIGMMETGRVDRPFPETLRRLSDALDISMQELVAATGQLEPPAATPDDVIQAMAGGISAERVNAEIERIAHIPGVEAKMQALGKLFVNSPALFDLVEQMVQERILESAPRPVQSSMPKPSNGMKDRL